MISFNEDSFINELAEHNTRWVVTLSDGRTVYYDDGRPGLENHSAWARLKSYCDEHRLHVTSMYLQFRSHYENIEPNKEGYFFCKAVRGVMTQENDRTYQYFLCGFVEDNKVKITKYSVPELIVVDRFEREIKDCEEYLIWAKNV